MMPDTNQPTPTPLARPSARAASGLPVQRGNYGLPPRPVASQPQPLNRPAPAGPRSMDIMPASRPRPVAPSQPQPAPLPVAPPAPIAPAPTDSVLATEQISVTQPTRQPLYAPKPDSVAAPLEVSKGNVLPKLRLALLIVGGLLLLGGAGRWITAGSTSGDLIAAGAVAANDGHSMTVQFTANDGQLHKFIVSSDTKLIPGSAVQVAYRSGAPDNGAKRVEPINAAHQLGTSLATTGVVLLLAAGLVTLLMHRSAKRPRPTSIAHPVTV